MAEYSKIAKGHFTSSGSAQVIYLPFTPELVNMTNYTQANSAATSQNIITASWDVSMGQGFAVILGYNATPALIYDVVSTNGISTFSAGLGEQFGAVVATGGSPVSNFSMTAANPIVVTTVGNHGLTSGNVVIFSNLSQSSITGMQQIAGIPFVVTVLTGTTFSIPWNGSGSNYTAFNTATSTGNVGSYKQLLYPALYAPSVSFISAITLASNAVISLTAPGNFVVGQEVAFRIPTVWGTTQLNALPNNLIPGQSTYGVVTAVSASLTTPTITININSSSYTAFNANQAFASYIGEKFPQVVPVGGFNSGGATYSGGNLYPSPQFWNGQSSTLASSINGPAIQGAFSNNTNQGFVIGAGAGRVLTTGVLVGANANVLYWQAYASDLPVN
jgi:hypothetical protein